MNKLEEFGGILEKKSLELKEKSPKEIKQKIKEVESELDNLSSQQWGYTKRLLEFGTASWIFGVSVFISVFLIYGYPSMIVESPGSISLLIGAAAAPVMLAGVFVRNYRKKIDRLEQTREELGSIHKEVLLEKLKRDARREKERFEELFEGANEMIFTTNKEGKILRVNKQVKEETGYSSREIVGENIFKIAHPEERYKYTEFRDKILAGKKPVSRLRALAKNGDTIHVIAAGRAIAENGDVVEIQYNAQNITERVEAEGRREFLYTLMAHDLGNKSTIIGGSLDLLQNTELSKEQKKYVKDAILSNQKSFELMKKVEMLRKVEREIVREADLNSSLEEAIEEHEDLA